MPINSYSNRYGQEKNHPKSDNLTHVKTLFVIKYAT